MKNFILFVLVMVLHILIIETLEGYTFVKTISIYYSQVKRFYLITLFHV